MFWTFKPLPCREVKRALKNLGFIEMPGKGSSHTQWEKIENGAKRKVTVDCHNGEVKAKNVKSIISQAKVTKAEFLDAM